MGPGEGMLIESAQDTRTALRRLVRFLSPYGWHMVGILALILLGTGLGLLGPYLFGYAVDTALAEQDLAGLIPIAVVLLVTYVLSWAAGVGQGYWLTLISQRLLRDLRQQLFDHLQGLSLKFFDENETGDLMSRLTNDVETLNRVLSNGLSQLVTSVLTVVGIMIAMLLMNVPLALVTLLIVPLMGVITGTIARRARHAYRDTQWAIGALNARSEESIAGVRVIQAFHRERESIAQFAAANARAREAGTRAETISSFLMPFLMVMSTLSIAIIAGMGGWLAIREMLSVGIIVAFIGYARRFFEPLRTLAELYNLLQSALAGGERIFQLLDSQPTVVDHPQALDLPHIRGRVEFDHVTFGYDPENPVLVDVTLKAEPGETIALVGPTGAGKTTTINLLGRFYDIQSGSILIDGIDVRGIRQASLRRQLGIVLQEPFLFSDSLLENIRYGKLDASDAEVIAAARMANADQFISRLPEGYNTLVSERGSNLSEGQRQLVSIARAILADPRILILDEATSSVDTRTEIQIQEAMLKLMEGRTAFVIAHRLSTIRHANQVLVINNQRIVESGTHEELLAKRGQYFDLYRSQFRRVELAEARAGMASQPDRPALSPASAS